LPQLPLIGDLTKEPIPPGFNILFEFDPTSEWYYSSITMAAGWLQTGGIVAYNTTLYPPNKIRAQLRLLGINPEDLEKQGRLEIWDWYTVTLGQKSIESCNVDSLKVQDLSITFGQLMKRELGGPAPSVLAIMDNYSSLARFNDEKAWVEFMLTRNIPSGRAIGCVVDAIIRDLHSDWVYKNLETAYDGVVDFKIEEKGEDTRDLIRIRSMRNIHFDRRWHKLNTGEKFEVSMDK
jgi:KaiC/GvpD/RAD55 family RecA-like ATPase